MSRRRKSCRLRSRLARRADRPRMQGRRGWCSRPRRPSKRYASKHTSKREARSSCSAASRRNEQLRRRRLRRRGENENDARRDGNESEPADDEPILLSDLRVVILVERILIATRLVGRAQIVALVRMADRAEAEH